MRTLRITADFARLDAFEVRLCRPVNAFAQTGFVRAYFCIVSRIGDWPLWVALLLALPLLYDQSAWLPVAHMAATSAVGILVYKVLKLTLVRERPFASYAEVQLFTRPMDRYSFPSGHTLHATAFMVMLASYYPGLFWLMLPVAVSIALSRVVLGLHYPSDVLAGAVIGFALARISLALGGANPV